MQSSFQSRIEREEQSLEAYREECYKGSARIQLNCLLFDNGFSHLINDGRNSIRLEHVLEIQGCLRVNRDYHVPVLISLFYPGPHQVVLFYGSGSVVIDDHTVNREGLPGCPPK